MTHDPNCSGPSTCRYCRSMLSETPEQACARFAAEDTERGLRSASFRAGADEYAAPDAYAPALAARKAAEATPASTFRERYAAERTAANQAEYAEWEARAAERPAPRVLSAADLKQYEPPHSYLMKGNR